MNTKIATLAFASLFLIALVAFLFPQEAYCDGFISGYSAASSSHSFPVLTGPGNTVFGPNGSYVIPQVVPQKTVYKSPTNGDTTPAGPHFVRPQIKTYNWASGKTNSAGDSKKSLLSGAKF